MTGQCESRKRWWAPKKESPGRQGGTPGAGLESTKGGRPTPLVPAPRGGGDGHESQGNDSRL